MRSRAALFSSAILLLSLSLGCSSKPSTDTANSDQNAPSTSSDSTGSKKGAAAKPAAEMVTVPAGTILTVRLGQAVGSKISNAGDSFSASLASPVEVGGKTVIPSGSEARGTVTEAKSLGKFKGAALLQIRLNSITINGAEHSIETSAVTRAEKGKGKRTAVIAGGGAAVGALIGGLAGGGKGAGIGALAGGAGGFIYDRLTHNR